MRVLNRQESHKANADNTSAKREVRDYKNLKRSVAQNHLRLEKTKVKLQKANPFESFLNNKWLLWLYHYLKSRFGPRHKFTTYKNSGDNGIYRLESRNNNHSLKIALASDWGTYTSESQAIGNAMAAHKPDYTIHMGDTYYVGAPFEIKNNFSPRTSPWPYGSVGSFALTGNHEMYSNGDAYYETLLPWMGISHPNRIVQKASYMCLENEYWRIIGLDTGYRSVGIPFLEYLFSKANLRAEVMDWLKNDLRIEWDNRGLILLTHHQYASSFDKEYSSVAKQLSEIIDKERKVLWFWGHEHRFAMYGKYSTSGGITAYGRCIGHGGMPITVVKKFNPKKIKQKNLVLLDNRIHKSLVDGTHVGHNGYAVLTLADKNLSVDYYDEKKLLVKEQWEYNTHSQAIEGKNITIYCPELKTFREVNKAHE